MSQLEIEERDEAGNLTASYIESAQQPLSVSEKNRIGSIARVDTIVRDLGLFCSPGMNALTFLCASSIQRRSKATDSDYSMSSYLPGTHKA